MAADRGPGRRRVFVEDARRNGQFLRVTWHGEQQQFVVSNWDDNLCVGATRVKARDVPDLVGLLVEGLADAASTAPSAGPPPPTTLREHLVAWWRERGRHAAILPIRRPAAEGDRRSA
jgi:hypothetical protein